MTTLTKYNATAARSTLAAASTSLAEHLRYGPLETLDELRRCAKKLAITIEADEREYLAELVELVRLAHTAMAEFHEFTRELTTLVGELAAFGVEDAGRSTK